MSRHDLAMEQIEQMAALMVQAIADLDCPECCDCGWAYQYVERSAELYREEYELALLSRALLLQTAARRSRPRVRRTARLRGAIALAVTRRVSPFR